MILTFVFGALAIAGIVLCVQTLRSRRNLVGINVIVAVTGCVTCR